MGEEPFSLGLDDQFGTIEFAPQVGVLAIELLDLPGGGVRLRSTLLRGQRRPIGCLHLRECLDFCV